MFSLFNILFLNEIVVEVILRWADKQNGKIVINGVERLFNFILDKKVPKYAMAKNLPRYGSPARIGDYRTNCANPNNIRLNIVMPL